MKTFMLFLFGIIPGVVLADSLPVRNVRVTRQGDQVSVSFQMQVPDRYIGRNARQTFTPVLFGGSDEIGLPSVSIVGKTRMKREKQEQALSRKKMPVRRPYLLKNGGSLSYRATIPYQSWMSDVAFGFDTEYRDCCKSVDEGRTVVARNIRLKKDFVPYYSPYTAPAGSAEALNESFMQPMSAYGQKANRTLEIYYPQNVSELDPGYRNNRSALERFGRVMTALQRDKIVILKKIVITGFASPEGTWERNEKLAGERASSLQRHLMAQYGLAPGLFEKTNGGINWTGLVEMLAPTGYTWKNEAERILQNVPEPQRLAELQKLDGGAPYRTMFREFFPALRTAVGVTFYYERSDEPEKRDVIFRLVKAGEYQQAIPLLLALPPDGWTYNMLGVCYQMSGETEKARTHFLKAVSQGNADALKNKEQLDM